MIRIVLENVVLFLLPTFVYFTYKLVARRGETTATRVLEDAPFVSLFILGSMLMVATLVVFGTNTGGKPGQEYQPGILKDGKIVPGWMK
jgi:Family of unknown function (DUF6111)